VERRHREALAVQVEHLEDRAAGVPPEPEDDVVGVVVKNLHARTTLSKHLPAERAEDRSTLAGPLRGALSESPNFLRAMREAP